MDIIHMKIKLVDLAHHIYNQIDNGMNLGSNIGTVMEKVMKTGVCPMNIMPYNENDSKTQPNSYQREIASNFKSNFKKEIIKPNEIDSKSELYGYIEARKPFIKRLLSSGIPVCVSIDVYKNFQSSGGYKNLSLSKDKDKAILKETKGSVVGKHAVCIIGYDDEIQAYKILNSWGEKWGVNGYGYISYKLFDKICSTISYGSKNIKYACIMTDLNQHYKSQVVGGVKALKDIKVCKNIDLKDSVRIIKKDENVKVIGFNKALNGNPPCFRVEDGYITAKKDSVKQVNTFKVRYQANGGSGTMSDTLIPYGISTTTVSNKFTKTGYTFNCWNVKRDSDNKWYYKNNTNDKKGWYLQGKQPSGYVKIPYGNGCSVARTSSVNNDIVRFYAQWKANTYTVSYNANGGTGKMNNTTVTYDKSTKTRTNTFDKKGYTFNCWYAKRASDNKWYYKNDDDKKGWYLQGKQPSGFVKYPYKNGCSVARTSSVNKDKVTFYAQWKKK